MIDAAAVRRFDRILERHRVRVAKVEPLMRFGDDDGRAAVWRKIHIIRIVDGNTFAGLAGERVDRRDAAVGAAFGVIVDPQSF